MGFVVIHRGKPIESDRDRFLNRTTQVPEQILCAVP